MSVIQSVSMRNVHNQHGHYGGQISLVFTMLRSVAVYGVDHSHGIPATFTGLAPWQFTNFFHLPQTL